MVKVDRSPVWHIHTEEQLNLYHNDKKENRKLIITNFKILPKACVERL